MISVPREQFEALEKRVAELEALVKWQAEKIESLMRQLYGAKSEKIKPEEISDSGEFELPSDLPALPEE